MFSHRTVYVDFKWYAARQSADGSTFTAVTECPNEQAATRMCQYLDEEKARRDRALRVDQRRRGVIRKC
jgi:hypothetical protein